MRYTTRRQAKAKAAAALSAALCFGIAALGFCLAAAAPLLAVGYGLAAPSATLANASAAFSVAMLASATLGGFCLVAHRHHSQAARR
jgi:hypothetical protein